MMIKEKMEVSDEMIISDGFGDVRSGTYMGTPVAVKTVRVAAKDDLQKIRKVNVNVGYLEKRSQPFHSSDSTRKSFCGKR